MKRARMSVALSLVATLGLLGWFTRAQGRAYVDALLEPVLTQGNQPETATGSIRGRVLSDEDEPVKSIQVDLIPTNKQTDPPVVLTDKDGNFEATNLELGEYLVAVHTRGGPTESEPFLTAYYPGVATAAEATRVAVTSATPIALYPFKLRRVPLTTINIKVVWSDGTPVPRSNLLFHNRSFPDQGVIGDVAPQITDGVGTFTLPVGYRYYARAKVDCDAGPKIETRESRPVQKVDINHPGAIQELTFVIAGPCKFWEPPPAAH